MYITRVPHGQKSFTHDNLFLGQLHKRIVMGLVDNRAFNSDLVVPVQLSTLQFKLFWTDNKCRGPVAAIIFRI